MVHAGFAVFFLLSLLVATIALVRNAVQNLPRIRSALGGFVVEEEAAAEFSFKACATADVPRIAARLRIRFPEGLAPVRRVPRAWPFEREDPSFG